MDYKEAIEKAIHWPKSGYLYETKEDAYLDTLLFLSAVVHQDKMADRFCELTYKWEELSESEMDECIEIVGIFVDKYKSKIWKD
jgi:hypothetical protein